MHGGDGSSADALHAHHDREISEAFKDGTDSILQKEHYLLHDTLPATARMLDLIPPENRVASLRAAQLVFTLQNNDNRGEILSTIMAPTTAGSGGFFLNSDDILATSMAPTSIVTIYTMFCTSSFAVVLRLLL